MDILIGTTFTLLLVALFVVARLVTGLNNLIDNHNRLVDSVGSVIDSVIDSHNSLVESHNKATVNYVSINVSTLKIIKRLFDSDVKDIDPILEELRHYVDIGNDTVKELKTIIEKD